MAVAKPIIRQIKDNSESLDFFETVSLPSEDEKTRKIIMDFPTVYIHNWKDSGDFEVYVGESNNIFILQWKTDCKRKRYSKII